jgi:capsular polysaccharide biosynthesis protein
MTFELARDASLTSSDPLDCVIEKECYATPFQLFSPESEQPNLSLNKYIHTRCQVVGAIYTKKGLLIDQSRRCGGMGGDVVESVDPISIVPRKTDEQKIYPGTTLYLGNFMNHYGHFITEFMSKLWCVDNIQFDRIVIRPFIFQKGKVVLFEFARQILSIILPPESKIEVLTDSAFFESIVIPSQGWPINSKCNISVRPVYSKVNNAFVENVKTSRRIFLTRHQRTSTRISNLARIEEIAAQLGFEIINTETMHIADQLRMYANCSVIAGFDGTAMHNCLFARPGTVVIDLGDTRARNKPHLMQSVAQAVSNVRMFFVPYKGTESGGADPEYLHASLSAILRDSSQDR